MKTTNLAHFLADNLEISEDAIAQITSKCKLKTYQKGNFILQQGQTCQHTFFVEEGLLRQYSIDEQGREHLLSFAAESWFISDRESVYFNKPSSYFIQALENCRVTLIDESLIQTLSNKIPEFSEFNNRLLHNHIRQLYHRINLLLSVDAEKRYLQFIKTYPNILSRVPQSMVASYLGITPESLSRVRKNLAEKYKQERS